jgi:hypothetical protein
VHSLSDQNLVPVFKQQLHADHWIADRIASPLSRLMNIENSYDWALEQTNLAVLVIFSDSEVNTVKRSETGFIQLGQEDKAVFLEQSGHAFEASQKRIMELREEIYRLSYLVAQGRSSSAAASVSLER